MDLNEAHLEVARTILGERLRIDISEADVRTAINLLSPYASSASKIKPTAPTPVPRGDSGHKRRQLCYLESPTDGRPDHAGEVVALAATAAAPTRAVHVAMANQSEAEDAIATLGPVFAALGLTSACLRREGGVFYEAQTPSDGDDAFESAAEPHECSHTQVFEAQIVYGAIRQFCLNTLSYELALAGADCDLTDTPYSLRSYGDGAPCPFDLMLIEDVGSFMADASPFTLCKIGPDQSEPIYHLAQVLFARELVESGPQGEGDYAILRDLEGQIERLEWLERGLSNLATWLDDEAVYDPDSDLRSAANAALAAWTIYVRERDYFVRDSEIVLLSYNGEASAGRHHPSTELYAALAAKEGLAVERASVELGAISADDYLARYANVAGILT